MTVLESVQKLLVQSQSEIDDGNLIMAAAHLAAAYGWLSVEIQNRQFSQAVESSKPTVGTVDAYQRSDQ